MSTHQGRLLEVIVAAIVAVALGACQQQRNMLKARNHFQTANGHYGSKEYQEAIANYEQVLALDPQGDRRVVLPTHFYIGSSHHLIFSNSRLDAEGRKMRIGNAINYYEKTIELVDQGGEFQDQLEVYKKYAAEQLAAIYRDNENDFFDAEKYCLMLISLEPNAPERYYALGDVYERFHDADEMPLLDKAIACYEKPVLLSPNDPVVYRQMAAINNRYGRFEQTLEWLSRARDLQVDSPEGYYLLATHYWDKVYRDPDLTIKERQEFINLGLGQLEKARELNPEYVDALVYTGLLLREQAKIEEISGNKRRADELVAEANRYRDRALELKKEQEAAAAEQQTTG